MYLIQYVTFAFSFLNFCSHGFRAAGILLIFSTNIFPHKTSKRFNYFEATHVILMNVVTR